jgi:hypothetical protein
MPDAYGRFAAGPAAAALIQIAKSAYLAASVGVEPPFLKPEPGTGRPAGPRDEPPPPEWPDGPVGLVLCLRVEGRLRACEGSPSAPSRELGTAAADLAEDLAASRSRGRRRPAREELREATVEVFFLPAVQQLGEEEMRTAGREGALDPARTGLLVRGAKGDCFVMPGEVRSVRKAVRLARKAGAVGWFGRASAIFRFIPVAAGSARLFSP